MRRAAIAIMAVAAIVAAIGPSSSRLRSRGAEREVRRAAIS
jgi:hypothetical protein